MHKLGDEWRNLVSVKVFLYGMPVIHYFCDHCVSLSMAMGDIDNTYTFGRII